MPARFRLRWYDPRKYVRDAKVALMESVAFQVAETAKEVVGVQGPPPSRPGEPPHVDTGALRAGMIGEVDPSTGEARVGSTAPYGALLDRGTGHIAPRPWVEPTLHAAAGRIRGLEYKG
jgi:hypothetical protein